MSLNTHWVYFAGEGGAGRFENAGTFVNFLDPSRSPIALILPDTPQKTGLSEQPQRRVLMITPPVTLVSSAP